MGRLFLYNCYNNNVGDYEILMNKRIPRKKGQPAKSKKHSDLYTDEDPKGTIQGLQFKNKRAAALSVAKIKRSNRSHNHQHYCWSNCIKIICPLTTTFSKILIII